MQENRNSSENLLLNRVSYKNEFTINEFIPGIQQGPGDKYLCWDVSGNIRWNDTITPQSLLSLVTEMSDIHLDGTRIGVGRKPLHNYKIDLGVPVNTRTTAFHIGDGVFGFSMGNGTWEGFVPEIVGMGADERDAGLYFLGKTSSSLPSNIPLIIIDGRNIDNTPLSNRPILGITNGNYSEYKLIVDHNGNVGMGREPKIYKLEVDGIICAKDMVTDSSVSLESLKADIDYLKTQIRSLLKK